MTFPLDHLALGEIRPYVVDAVRNGHDTIARSHANDAIGMARKAGILNGREYAVEDVLNAARAAIEGKKRPEKKPDSVTLDSFYAYMPTHQYIFTPTRELWPASSVNQRVDFVDKKLKATDYLDKCRAVEQMTWIPGEPMLIEGRLVSNGGWIQHAGCRTFNLYKEPVIADGNPDDVEPWLLHVVRLCGKETDHVLDWLAHRVQRPGEKINHALVIGGNQGIGKDTILEPVKHAVGPWNFSDVSPTQVLGRFNSFVKSVILRVSEARDLGDVDRYAFYEHMKTLTASPPDVLRCDEKNLREYAVFNVCGVIITSNHKSDGIYLPADDRRHFVVWSDLSKDDFTPNYWHDLYAWFASGGTANVSAYLRRRDLSAFNPKAPPRKTEAFFEIVNSNRAPEDAELADVLDVLGNPSVLTLEKIIGTANGVGRTDFANYLQDRKNRRVIPHRLEDAGYVPVRNRDDRRDGQWLIDGRRQTIYSRRELPERDRQAAARGLTMR